jgi:hypothetical protein
MNFIFQIGLRQPHSQLSAAYSIVEDKDYIWYDLGSRVNIITIAIVSFYYSVIV